MAVEANETIEISTLAEYRSEPLGMGLPKPTCGGLRLLGHPKAGVWHVKGGYVRCHRADCRKCYDRPRGFLDQAQRRIERGLLRGKAPGADLRVQEYIVTPPGSEEIALLDKEYLRLVVKEVRAAFEGKTVNPGAWILHWRPREAPDTCPQAPHVHFFIETIIGSLPVGEPVHDIHGNRLEFNRIGLGLKIRRMPKPELYPALLSMGRVYNSGFRGRRSYVTLIGWFGRRKGAAAKVQSDPEEGEGRRQFCPGCHTEVVGWSVVQSRTQKFTVEGFWELPEHDVVPVEPAWYTRGG